HAKQSAGKLRASFIGIAVEMGTGVSISGQNSGSHSERSIGVPLRHGTYPEMLCGNYTLTSAS
ncbi:MAG: hypothetical protein KDE31_34295, partial [Caldilineaceae bacterium]|nr:hypothetical protein [Caldilineaceae bacterium]